MKDGALWKASALEAHTRNPMMKGQYGVGPHHHSVRGPSHYGVQARDLDLSLSDMPNKFLVLAFQI